MSGRAGFQPIGGGMQPLPMVQPPVAAAPVSGANREEAPQDPQPAAAVERSLVGKLDAMLLKAAERSTKAVDVNRLVKGVSGCGLSSEEIAELGTVAAGAAESFAALSKFTGREIAAALVEGEGGSFEWKDDDPVASAIRKALDDQAALSEKLHELANDRRVGAAFDAVCDHALMADRRQSEIFSLAIQLADAVAQSGEDPAVNAKLDAKLATLLPAQALSMHGNADAIDMMKEKLQPLADRIEAFRSRPNASITEEELACYTLEVVEAEAAIARAATQGFPTGNGGRWEPDKAFLGSAKALVTGAKTVLLDVRKQVGMASAAAFVSKTFALSDGFVPVYEENLYGLKTSFPRLAAAAEIRYKLHDLAKKYLEDADDATLSKMRSLAVKLARVGEKQVREEVAKLRKTSAGEYVDMTDDDWNAFESEFSHIKGMLSQVEHLAQMVKRVEGGLGQYELLSTTTAQALLVGKIPFSTLVEARVHGMSDDDVDPSLDDSRVVSSERLGSGAANTVYLVKYEDGAEYVFKPESAGRQGMESLSLTKDYKPHQQVAELNIATQKTADALGLGDVVPKSTVGSHKGCYGLFMEKVPGAEARQFASGRAKIAPGKLSAKQIRDLRDEDYAKVIGGIMRQTNRLEWLDIITGQGDRHNSNYMIEVGEDLKVSVKGIDNDECFPAYRAGMHSYVLEKPHASFFRTNIEEIVKRYPANYQDEIRERLNKDAGIEDLGNGRIRINTARFENKELLLAARKAIGMQGADLPDFIDEDLYAQLMAMKPGQARDAWMAELRRRLPEDALVSAVARLDEAIAHAESLAKAGMVVKNEDFFVRDVQNKLYRRHFHAPLNQIKPTADNKFTLQDKEVVGEIQYQTRPLFVRDLFYATRKSGWYA